MSYQNLVKLNNASFKGSSDTKLNGDPLRMNEGEDDVLSGLGVGEDPGS